MKNQKNNKKTENTKTNVGENKVNTDISKAFLHVYQKDVDNTLKNKKTSLIRLMEKKTGEKLKNVRKTTTYFSMTHAIFISFVFVVVGFLAIYIVNKINEKNNQARVFYKSITKQIVLFDTDIKLDITGLTPYAIKQLIANSIPYKPSGTLLEIGLYSKAQNDNPQKISVNEFFERLNLSLEKEYIDFIDDYFVGAFYDRFGAYPVILFKSKNPNALLYGIRRWEYKAPVELNPVFILNTKTPTELFGSDIKYIDTAIDNVDIRVLPNKDGDPILIYGILDQNIIFLTNSTDSIKEINRRLQYN